jgi:hypothetical protein
MLNQLTRRKTIPASRVSAPLRMRPAGLADATALERLAALDSSHVPTGDVLLAEVGDELWAALSLADGHAVSDPMRPAADAVLMLAQRGRQLGRAAHSRGHGRRRLRFARA